MEQHTRPESQRRFVEQLTLAGHDLIRFVRNPLQGMRSLPNWDWAVLLAVQAIVASISGALKGLVARDLVGVFAGLVFVPVTITLTTAIAAGFFYYTILLVFKKVALYQNVYRNVFFASLPALAMMVLSPFLQPLNLIGLAASCLLLAVGLVENFKVDRRLTLKFIGALYGIFLVFWIINTISHHRGARDFRDHATPESLDILEKEFNNK